LAYTYTYTYTGLLGRGGRAGGGGKGGGLVAWEDEDISDLGSV
jgi:hypothetical protein